MMEAFEKLLVQHLHSCNSNAIQYQASLGLHFFDSSCIMELHLASS